MKDLIYGPSGSGKTADRMKGVREFCEKLDRQLLKDIINQPPKSGQQGKPTTKE
jgi:hypothetical protein